jgi:phage terminase large subunit-like protein
MATLRVAEKAAQDARVTAELVVSLVITGVKDSMVAADEAHKQNAAWLVPVKITWVVRPLRRTHAFSHVNDDDDDDSMVREGQ